MSEVSTSFSLEFGVRSRVVATGETVQHGVRSRVVATPKALQFGVRKTIYPAKVFAISHNVRKRVAKTNITIRYGVRVPIAATGGAFSSAFSSAFDSAPGGGEGQKVFSVAYNVRSRVQKSVAIEYDTGIVGPSVVSKSFSIKYHTMFKGTVDQVITKPLKPDEVPPQIITTSL